MRHEGFFTTRLIALIPRSFFHFLYILLSIAAIHTMYPFLYLFSSSCFLCNVCCRYLVSPSERVVSPSAVQIRYDGMRSYVSGSTFPFSTRTLAMMSSGSPTLSGAGIFLASLTCIQPSLRCVASAVIASSAPSFKALATLSCSSPMNFLFSLKSPNPAPSTAGKSPNTVAESGVRGGVSRNVHANAPVSFERGLGAGTK